MIKEETVRAQSLNIFIIVFISFLHVLFLFKQDQMKWHLNSSCGHFHVLTSHTDVLNHTPDSPEGIYKVKPDNNAGQRREGRSPRRRPPARSVLQHRVNQSAFLPHKTFWHFSMKLAVTTSLHVSTLTERNVAEMDSYYWIRRLNSNV